VVFLSEIECFAWKEQSRLPKHRQAEAARRASNREGRAGPAELLGGTEQFG